MGKKSQEVPLALGLQGERGEGACRGGTESLSLSQSPAQPSKRITPPSPHGTHVNRTLDSRSWQRPACQSSPWAWGDAERQREGARGRVPPSPTTLPRTRSQPAGTGPLPACP